MVLWEICFRMFILDFLDDIVVQSLNWYINSPSIRASLLMLHGC